jgi:vacuolar-type H+-ATPase subunit F/Vma7
MSSPVVYVGDEVSAAGYRLAGARVVVPRPGGEAHALDEARAVAELVLVSAAIASRIGESALRAAMRATAPLVLVVPGPLGESSWPDLAGRIRAQLGLDA